MATGILLPFERTSNPVHQTQLINRASSTARTFRDAAKSYIENGGEGRYLGAVMDYFGDRPLDDIHPFDLKEMANALYPDRKNATKNRQALSPARSVMIHAYERGWCALMRLRRFKEDPPKRKKPASQTWLHAFARQCEKEGKHRLAAMVLFMASTGARVSEAANLRWREVDLATRSVILLRTKTEINSPRTLTTELVARLATLQPGSEPDERVFGYSHRQTVNQRIKEVCARAGISYKSSHACGRHSFATNAMAMGVDIKTVMEAGRWRSSAIFLEVYVHGHRNAGRVVADRFGQYEFEARI